MALGISEVAAVSMPIIRDFDGPRAAPHNRADPPDTCWPIGR